MPSRYGPMPVCWRPAYRRRAALQSGNLTAPKVDPQALDALACRAQRQPKKKMMKTQHTDIAILGLGAMGLSALHQAASRGLNVLGIDQFDPPHIQGSSHGETRLIREAYSEDPRYIPLIRRALELWRQHAAEMDGDIFRETGVQYFGPADDPRIEATRAAAAYDIPLTLTGPDTSDGKAPFDLPKGWDHFHETRAGYLGVETYLSQLRQRAEAQGATCLTGRTIRSAVYENGQWRIELDDRWIKAETAIFTAGPWSHDLIPDLQKHLVLERNTLHWLEAPADDRFTREAGFRPFVAHLPRNKWIYGFPANEEGQVKIAEHSTGERFSRWHGMDRAIRDKDRTRIEDFCRTYAPSLGPIRKSVTCMYTMSPDGNFIIDRHPQDKTGVFAAGLSGHGYKFAPVIGELLVKLALQEDPGFDLSLFSLSRLAAQAGQSA